MKREVSGRLTFEVSALMPWHSSPREDGVYSHIIMS